MYHRVVVAGLLCREYRVRKRAQQCVRKLLTSLGGGDGGVAYGLVAQLSTLINQHKVALHSPAILQQFLLCVDVVYIYPVCPVGGFRSYPRRFW